jgi:hypothetical protein
MNASKLNASKLSQGGFFVAANLLAGLLHYVFQVVAARELSAPSFAELNGWLADVSVFAAAGGLLQYASNFRPASRARLRSAIVGAGAAAVLLACMWRFGGAGLTPERGLAVVFASCMFGWLLGQAQIRMAFVVMGTAGLIVAASKLAFTFVPFFDPADVERFGLPIFACYGPGVLVLILFLWQAPNVQHSAPGSWAAPLILSMAAAVIPQFDMVLMNHTQPPEIFQDFARASLFYKGIYFVVFIVAQWLLPQQIQARSRTAVKALVLTGAAAAAASAMLSLLSPWISTLVMHWPVAPQAGLVFWSCLHMSLLTLLFLWIQEACAHGRTRVAAFALAALALEALLQSILRLPAGTYLIAITAVQMSVLSIAYNGGRSTRP